MTKIEADRGHRPVAKGKQCCQCTECMDVRRPRKKWRRACPFAAVELPGMPEPAFTAHGLR